MDRVARLRRRRAGDPTVDVVLESGEVIRVHDRRVGEHRLAAGAKLGPPAVDALRRAAEADAFERRALRLIARRPRSRAELRARMAEWGLEPAAVTELLDRLEELRAVDDPAVARAVAEHGSDAGHGRRRIAADLARRGLAEDTAEPALAALPTDDAGRAIRLVERRFGAPPYTDRDARRAAAFLARRGFDEDVIAAAVGRDPGD